jgi:hypothetical protein
MPIEDTGKDAATDHADKPARHATDRPSDRTIDRPRATERPRPAAADDDPLGKLQGGVKPGDRKPRSR